jgi:hypothetical protein
VWARVDKREFTHHQAGVPPRPVDPPLPDFLGGSLGGHLHSVRIKTRKVAGQPISVSAAFRRSKFSGSHVDGVYYCRRGDGIDTRVAATGRIALDPPGIETTVEEVYGP